MDYQVYTPAEALQPFVKCYWTLDDEAHPVPEKQRVLPDGCMEMIIHYGDHYRQFMEDGSSIIQPRSFVFGQITHYLEIAPTGVTGIVAARFLPAGLAPLLRCPVSSLENKAVALASLFEGSGELETNILSATNNRGRTSVLETFLLAQLQTPQTVDNITRSCVEVIVQSQGQLGVVELAGKMQVNRRSLERRFTSTIGMSPKQLSRAMRLQSALKMMEEKKFNSLTELAYENGYYDQAHFIKDFREFTGISPKAFYASNLRLAAMFASAD